MLSFDFRVLDSTWFTRCSLLVKQESYGVSNCTRGEMILQAAPNRMEFKKNFIGNSRIIFISVPTSLWNYPQFKYFPFLHNLDTNAAYRFENREFSAWMECSMQEVKFFANIFCRCAVVSRDHRKLQQLVMSEWAKNLFVFQLSNAHRSLIVYLMQKK